tara:strand:+ start:373 stop:678 length:306 start_codon:yes stop_codon:yes gene_type:complete
MDRTNKKRKVDDDYENELENFMNIDLDNFKAMLFNKKYEYQLKIRETDELIKKTNSLIAEKCKKINGNHEWISEREPCLYGERYTFCKKCRIDINDKEYIH